MRNFGWHWPPREHALVAGIGRWERVRHSGWHRAVGASTSFVGGIGRWGRVRHSGWHQQLGRVRNYQFADRGGGQNKFTIGDTNDLSPQIKKLVERERRGTGRWRCMRPWWRVRSCDHPSASVSSHSFASARCRDRGGGIHIHVAVVRGGITRVQFHGDTTNEWELVNGTYPGEEKRDGDLHENRQNIVLNVRNQNTTVKRMVQQTKEPKGR